MDFNNRPLTSVFTDRFFLFLAFVLLFISLLYKQTNLILISILILIMFYVSKLWSRLSIKNIYYSFDAEKKKGFPGEQISLNAEIRNNKFLPIWLKLTIPIDNRVLSSNSKDKYLREEFSLLWNDHSLWEWKLTARHRGCYTIGPPYLETGDLLGLFQQRKYLSQSVEMIIYPRTIFLKSLSNPMTDLFGKPGIDSPIKDPVYPIATQDYYHGNPAKYIHWKASAHHNRLQSKVFDSSYQRKTLLIIDVGSFINIKQEDLFEKTLEVVAAIIMEFYKKGNPYGILSNGRITGNYRAKLPIATGPEQFTNSMELLARLQLKSTDSLQEMLFKKEIIPGGTGYIYCAGTLNKKNLQVAEFLKQHHVPVKFIVAESSSIMNKFNLPILMLDEIHGGVIENLKAKNSKKNKKSFKGF